MMNRFLQLATLLLGTGLTAGEWNLRNGGTTDGSTGVTHWQADGKATVRRDTKTWKVEPASLCVEVQGQSGMGEQMINRPGALTFRLAGWIKATAGVKAQIAVQCFDRQWTKNKWIQVKYLRGPADWTAFAGEVKLPEWSARFRVMLFVEGTGKAWLDEVRIGDQPVPAARKPDPAKDSPPPGKPWTPAWCIYDWRAAWVAQHEAHVKRAARGDIDIVFYGDSITAGWRTEGKDVWARTFVPLKAVNFGIGGDSTRQLLYRIGDREVAGLAPKVVVLMIGTNNLYGDLNRGTNEEIARGIKAVIDLLRAKLPGTRILLCGILPRQNKYFSDRIKRINQMIAKYDDGKTVRFLNLRRYFMKKEPGTVVPELFIEPEQDRKLHLTAKGYAVWAKQMLPLLQEMLKAE